MDERAKPPNPNASWCGTHRLSHGPVGCPVCLHFSKDAGVEGLPVIDDSLHGAAAVADFWRRYGVKSVGLLILGGLGLFAVAPWRSPRTSSMDPAPYRNEIMALESVLFYDGPTDGEAHQKLVGTLISALVAAVKANPPALRGERLIGALEGVEQHWRDTSPEVFRLSAARKSWVGIREGNFAEAVWFRLRDDKLDAVQSHLQGEGPQVDGRAEALEILNSYQAVVEGFSARAGYLASRACAEGVDRKSLNLEYRSLSADVSAGLDTIPEAADQLKPLLAPLVIQARLFLGVRSDLACGTSVPSEASLAREYAAFLVVANRTRARLEAEAPRP